MPYDSQWDVQTVSGSTQPIDPPSRPDVSNQMDGYTSYNGRTPNTPTHSAQSDSSTIDEGSNLAWGKWKRHDGRNLERDATSHTTTIDADQGVDVLIAGWLNEYFGLTNAPLPESNNKLVSDACCLAWAYVVKLNQRNNVQLVEHIESLVARRVGTYIGFVSLTQNYLWLMI